MDIPYHSQHTMSRNHRPASEVPFKNGRKEGGGRVCVWEGGDRLESPVETHSILVGFFACVVVVFVRFWGGGCKLLI